MPKRVDEQSQLSFSCHELAVVCYQVVHWIESQGFDSKIKNSGRGFLSAADKFLESEALLKSS